MNNSKDEPLSTPMPNNLGARIKPGLGIGTKIILPYLLLTLIVAGAGAFVISNLVTSSLQERFNTQLLDAGLLVSESTVQFENNRLQTLRAVAGTIGVPDAVANLDKIALSELIPQIIANSNNHAVKLLDSEGIEIYGWQQIPTLRSAVPAESSGDDLSNIEEIHNILNGFLDDSGDKRVFLSDTFGPQVLYTAGPILFNDEIIGVVMVGDEIHQMVTDLTIAASAQVTLYDKEGQVLDTALAGGEETGESAQIVAILNENQDKYQAVASKAAFEVPLRTVNLLDQEYVLAFSDWRLRGQSFGMFSVALSSNFIVSTLVTGRNLLSVIFSVATIGVLAVGFFTAQRIIKPVDRLVETALAVTAGDLESRSGIENRDEIGKLAKTFDIMTDNLARRNRELLEQASKLEAILNSIADGVIVLDLEEEFITTNPAAKNLINDMSNVFSSGPFREFPVQSNDVSKDSDNNPILQAKHTKRYQIGNRFLDTRAAPVKTPEGERLGEVIVLRDITSEAEADQLKDAFITNISHELRTPLTVIKVYTDLILKTANDHMDDRQMDFLEKISNNSEHLSQQINQLINISELQAGTFVLAEEKVNFVSLVSRATENWRERIESKGLTFDIQQPSDPVWVLADRDQLSWAFENLLSNAHNYTESGDVKVLVELVNGEVQLDVTDTGIGIASVDQSRVFDRFFRTRNAANYNIRGVGLGLFITRSIIELHNGRISLESESGQGSTFSITLPLEE